jgi:CRISPR/Cas system Type II protein with McrA/HNH and RuvC-like nuclease domain
MNVDRWTYSRLFEYLQENLGIGDFSGEPSEYHAWKMRQIGMIKRMMERRKVSMAEMVTCAEYCKAKRIQPESHAGLLWHYDAARKWKRSRHVEAIQVEFDEAVAQEQERVFSDEEASRWVDMLLRATGPNREEVLERWRKERSHV